MISTRQVFAVLATVCLSCYASHELSDRDAGIVRDAPVDVHADIIFDAEFDSASCACGPASLVATITSTPEHAPVALLDAVRTEDVLHILVARFGTAPGSLPTVYEVISVDLSTGRSRTRHSSEEPHSPELTIGGELGTVSAEGVLAYAVGAAEEIPTRATSFHLTESTWADVNDTTVLATITPEMPGCDCLRPVALATYDSEVAALVATDGQIEGVVFDTTSRRVLRDGVFAFYEGSAIAPIETTYLPSGELVIVGGGSVSDSRSAELAFMTIAREDAVPHAAMLPGAESDPPPAIAAFGEGFAIYRFVTDAADVAHSAVHEWTYDSEGNELGERTFATPHGLTPILMDASVAPWGASVTWAEPSVSDVGALNLRTVVTSTDDSCAVAEPTIHLDFPLARWQAPNAGLLTYADEAGLFVMLLEFAAINRVHVYFFPRCER